MSRPFSLTMFLTFSSVKFLSEFIRIAFFCLINFCNLLGRQNLAEFIIIFLANIQYLTTLRKLILDLLFYFRTGLVAGVASALLFLGLSLRFIIRHSLKSFRYFS